MKVKEIDRIANIAWSPAAQHPIYLAAGTAAQQLDATFSTLATLELYDLNLSEPGLDMCLKGSAASNFRFHKIVWGCMGMKPSENANGIIVGGADGGNLLMYDPAKLLNGQDAILFHKTKHCGAVQSLDFNKFQECLLASGGGDSEIYIWDLNNPSAPMAPGSKSQPTDDVTSVAWNCQVQHILASTFPARCVVWDLRKNEPIIKVSDTASRLHCKMVAWHPEVATQLCIASDDDHSPLIQLWDLRFATTPVRNLERHQRGVLSIAWCPQDPDLLLSCGKDNKIFCWNPNSPIEGGEVICELPTGNQWSFDVSWCLRNPAVIASSSCDGRVSLFSLMGGQQQGQCSSKIAESFPGSDTMSQPLVSTSSPRRITVSLKKPPKWLRKPTRASFGFGGKLVYFINDPITPASGGISHRVVYISKVVTEPELLMKAAQLESAVLSKNFHEYCENKIKICEDSNEKMNWTFLQAMFSASPRTIMLSLLGYENESVKNEVTARILAGGGTKLSGGEDLPMKMDNLTTFQSPVSGDGSFDAIAAKSENLYNVPFAIEAHSDDLDAVLNRALLTGNIEAAVELCLQKDRWADALVLSQAGGSDLLQKTQKLYFKSVTSSSSKLISAVGTSDWISLVTNCDIDYWKESLAAILTYAKSEEFCHLCDILGSRLETEKKGILVKNAALCYISSGNFERLAQCWAKFESNIRNIATLQSLVEQVTILRSAVEQLSGITPSIQNSELSLLFGLYSSMLSSQGNLVSATVYLSDTKEQSLAILRDRVSQALGRQTPYFPFQVINVQKTSNQDMPYQQQQFINPEPKLAYQPQTQPFHPQSKLTYQPQTQLINPEPQNLTFQPQSKQQSFNYSSSAQHPQHSFSSSNMQQYQPPVHRPPSVPPTSFPPPVQTSVPPPSETTGNLASGVHHISQRYPKHLHDPSVYSENLPSQSPFAQCYSQQQLAGFPTQSIPQTTVSYYSVEPPSNVAPVYSSGIPYVPTAIPGMYGEMKTGWNDPPPLRQATGAQPSGVAYEAAPITSPFFEVPTTEVPQITAIASGGYYNSTFNVPSHNQPVNIMNESVPRVPPPTTPVATIAEPVQEKSPIPPEHRLIYDVFEDLRRECLSGSWNPQVKRKLEDVVKKMENLYDHLRENALSEPILQGLHQIVQAILRGDYDSALQIHGYVVSTTNFSEICGFMPGVKVLIQTAIQLHVYLQ